MTWMEISALSAAVAFMILVGFAVPVLIEARNGLRELRAAIEQGKQNLAQTAAQSNQLIERMNELTADVHTQVRTLQASFQSINQAGAAIEDVASALRKAASVMNQSIQGVEKVVHTHQDRLQDAVEWATTGMELWRRWQTYRNARSKNPEE